MQEEIANNFSEKKPCHQVVIIATVLTMKAKQPRDKARKVSISLPPDIHNWLVRGSTQSRVTFSRFLVDHLRPAYETRHK